MNIVRIDSAAADRITPLAAEFRAALRVYRGVSSRPDVEAGREGMIRLLRTRGYTVLNLIEIRKLYGNEKPTGSIHVKNNVFDN